MIDRLLPTQDEIAAYNLRKIEEGELDTGLHTIAELVQPTPRWILESWQKAIDAREAVTTEI